MKYYEIMDGRAQFGTIEAYEDASCLVSCNSIGDAKRNLKYWNDDSTVWETDDSLEYPASTRMVYTMGKWLI